MKITTISDKTKTTEYRTVKLKLDGGVTVTEGYVDGKLASQVWGMVGGFKKLYKKVYEANNMFFQYYEDISWLDSELTINMSDSRWYDEQPEPVLITDWDTFKGFDHVICDRTGYEGNIYSLGKVTPIPMWRRQDYIGGFTSEMYRNLPELQNELAALPFIRNAEMMDIPYYNGGGRAIEFEYKLPVRVWDSGWNIENPQVAKIAKKYLKPKSEREY